MEGERSTEVPTIHPEEEDMGVCAKLHDNLTNSFPPHISLKITNVKRS